MLEMEEAESADRLVRFPIRKFQINDNYRIASPEPREVKVRVNGELKTVIAEKS
jgi:uncharacterized protein YabE (DUF348 family)